MWGHSVTKSDQTAGLIVELVRRTNLNDATLRAIEVGLLFIGGALLTVAGAIYAQYLVAAIISGAVGFLLGLLGIRFSWTRSDRETGPLADAVAASAEAKVRQSDAKLLALQAEIAIKDITAQRDEERAVRIRAETLLAQERDGIVERRALRKAMLRALEAMHEATERAGPNGQLVDTLEAMLDASLEDLVSAFNFEKGERYTFSIFSRDIDEAGPKMVRLLARSNPRSEELDRRQWRAGDGYTGHAWRERVEVVEPDTAALGASGKYIVSTENYRKDDSRMYVSVAAIPIRIGSDEDGRDNIVGVITATSDKKGRFLRDATDPRAQNLDLLLQIEAIVAAQISIRRRSDGGAFKAP
jgi:hypothetical protein